MRESTKYANDKAFPSSSTSGQKSEVKMRKIRRVGTTCWDYQAKENDELSFRHGSVVEILNDESCEDGWVMARIDKKKGMVPGNYVVLVGFGPNLINSEDVKRADLLASGGFANVFRGYYKNQEVALKIPKSSTENNREDLEREALILSRISHENIVAFFGYSLDPLLIALELCRGGALINLYRRMASSDILTVICWAKQVASAIQHLHSRNDPVIYADLKAENVLIKEIPCLCGLDDESWKIVTNYTKNNLCRKCKGLRIDLITLKISDFNVSENGTLVKNESCDGSVPWMSPEVLECSGVTTMIDVWSFGNFKWELLSRKIPYKNQGIYSIRNFMKNDLPLPLPDDLPIEMRKIFESCWKKNPVERSPIKDIIEMLDVAEQNIDNNYKWILPKEQPEEAKNNQIPIDQYEESLNSFEFNSGGESIKIPIYEAIMLIQRYGTILPKGLDEMKKLGISLHPPTPAKRLKKSKLNKESIGPPINFRHNVSARVRSSSSDDKAFSDEKILIIHRLKKDQDRHRSHDSLLDQNVEDKEENSTIYSTLPLKSQQMNVKTNRPDKFRKHDYLTLSTCSKIGTKTKDSSQQSINKTKIPQKLEEKRNSENDSSLSNEETTKNFELRKERGLSRTNAVRPKISEQLIPETISNASSPSGSSSSEGFVVNPEGFVVVSANGADFQNPSIPSDKSSFNVTNLFSRRISPPQNLSITPTSARNSIQNEEHRKSSTNLNKDQQTSRKSSSNQSNSIFYVPSTNESKTTTPESDSSSNDPNIGKHSVKRGWMNKIFGTSPRPSICGEDFGSEANLEEPVQLEKMEKIGFDKQHDTTPKYKKRTESSNIVKSRHKSNSINPIHSSRERLSINTVIQMQDDYQQLAKPKNLFFEPIDENYSNSYKMSNSARSYTDLNTNVNDRNVQSRSFIPEEADCFHQRSKSSESPIPSQTSLRNDLLHFLMQPIPSNITTITNPSYVPMKENQKAILPSYSPKHFKNPKIQTPIPLPRSKYPLGAPRQISSNDLPWPTSIAPMLEKTSQLQINTNNGPVVRPNSLRLLPPLSTTSSPLNTTATPSTSTTTTSLFTNSNNSFLQEVNNPIRQCDSGIYPEGSTDDETKLQHLDHANTSSEASPQIRHRSDSSGTKIFQSNLSPPPLPPKRIHGPRVPPLPFNIKKVDRFL